MVQTEEAVFTTKAEANIQYIKSELEALSDGGSLQEIALDPIQVLPILEHVSAKFRLYVFFRLHWASQECQRVKIFRLWIRLE